jgi:hypothetical protein
VKRLAWFGGGIVIGVLAAVGAAVYGLAKAMER